MREQDLNLAPQQWKDSAIKRGHRLRVALDDKILLDARIAELEARELGWLTTLSTMELEKRELEAENQRLHAGIANAMLCDSVVQMHECLAALMGGGDE